MQPTHSCGSQFNTYRGRCNPKTTTLSEIEANPKTESQLVFEICQQLEGTNLRLIAGSLLSQIKSRDPLLTSTIIQEGLKLFRRKQDRDQGISIFAKFAETNPRVAQEVVSGVIADLSQRKNSVSHSSVEALNRWVEANPERVEEALTFWEKPLQNPELKTVAIEAMGKLLKNSVSTQNVKSKFFLFLSLIKEGPNNERSVAVRAVADLVETRPELEAEAVPVLLELVSDSHWSLIKSIGSYLGKPDPELVELKVSVFKSFERIVSTGSSFFPTLISTMLIALKDPDYQIRWAAGAAIKELVERAPHLLKEIPALLEVDVLKEFNDKTAKAFRAASHHDLKSAEQFLSKLFPLLEDSKLKKGNLVKWILEIMKAAPASAVNKVTPLLSLREEIGDTILFDKACEQIFMDLPESAAFQAIPELILALDDPKVQQLARHLLVQRDFSKIEISFLTLAKILQFRKLENFSLSHCLRTFAIVNPERLPALITKCLSDASPLYLHEGGLYFYENGLRRIEFENPDPFIQALTGCLEAYPKELLKALKSISEEPVELFYEESS